MERKHVILLTVIAVATLLTAMVGATFAFFTATVTGNPTEDQKGFDITAAEVTADYTEGSEINATNITPSNENVFTKVIKVTNNMTTTSAGSANEEIGNINDAIIEYFINFNSYSNGFSGLKYKLEASCATEYNSKGASPCSEEDQATDTKTKITSDYITSNWTSLSQTTSNAEEQGPVTYKNEPATAPNSGVLATGKLKAGETAYLKFSIQLPETNNPQNEDQGKTLTAKLQAEAHAYIPAAGN